MANVQMGLELWTAPPRLDRFDVRSNGLPILLLPSRLFLFAVFQIIIAAVIWLVHGSFGLQNAAIYFPFAAVGANCVTVLILNKALRLEGLSLRDIYRFERETVGKDILAVVVVFAIVAPLAVFPTTILGNLIFGNANVATPGLYNSASGSADQAKGSRRSHRGLLFSHCSTALCPWSWTCASLSGGLECSCRSLLYSHLHSYGARGCSPI